MKARALAMTGGSEFSLLDENLIAHHCQMLCKNCQQFDGGIVLFLRNHLAGKIRLAERLRRRFHAPFFAQLGAFS